MTPTSTGLLIDDQTPNHLVSAITAWFSANTSFQPVIIRLNDHASSTVTKIPEVVISLVSAESDYYSAVSDLIIEVNTNGYLTLLSQGQIPVNIQQENTFTYRINEIFKGHRTEVNSGRFRLTGYAPSKNARQLFTMALLLIKETLERVANGRVQPLAPLPELNAELLTSVSGITHIFNTLFRTYKWNIGIIHQPIHEVAFSKKQLAVEWMKEAPGNDFRADPFGYILKNRECILYEYYDYKRQKGYIRKSDISGDHFYLESATHLSYPFTFERKGKMMCMPEAADSGTISLYSIDGNTPRRQENLLSFQAVDPTICYYNNRWWLFFTDKHQHGADLKLHIYFSNEPEGPWTRHPLNPVKTDICTARPGGTPFIHNGKLYRPVQDSSKGYGSALYIMEVKELTTERFEEVPVNRLAPEMLSGPYQEGLHTISPLGNKTLVDAKRTNRTIQPFLRYFVK